MSNCAVCFNGGLDKYDPIEYESLSEFKLCKKHQEELEKKEKEVNTDFPKAENEYIKSEIFQDQSIPVIFKGWEKKANEDRKDKEGNLKTGWKQNLKFVLRYSFPEFALDEAGEKILDKEGNPLTNKNYDPKYPHGYTVLYYFDIGKFETGSLPLFRAFCHVQPKTGDLIIIGKVGKDKETKWSVKKAKKDEIHAETGDDIPTIQLNENGEEIEEAPF